MGILRCKVSILIKSQYSGLQARISADVVRGSKVMSITLVTRLTLVIHNKNSMLLVAGNFNHAETIDENRGDVFLRREPLCSK